MPVSRGRKTTVVSEAPNLALDPETRHRQAQLAAAHAGAGGGAGAGAAASTGAGDSVGAAVAGGASDGQQGPNQSDRDMVRSTGSMAIATLISRITGFLRTALIGVTLGPAIASAFNTANTLPNLITEIVLGAVLTSLVVPVLVRAEKEDPDNGEAFIRRLLTVSLSILAVVTVIAVIGAPILTRMALDSQGQVNVPLATAFAFLLLPQIIFYGVFALLMAILNINGIFKPGAWAPVANNLIAISTLLLYWTLPGMLPSDHDGHLSDPHILLLGLGTTLGVVVQALIMVPYLLKAGINLKPLWGIDDRLKQFGNMGIAIISYVAVSQVGYFITTRIASKADEAAPTIYQQSWLLLQVPYGIIGVTLLTALMPRLSRNAADNNTAAVVRDLSVATRLTLLGLIPIVAFFSVFGQPIAISLFAYGNFPVETAINLGWTLSFSAFTLIPYAIVLLHLRVFYAREEAWTPTFIILGITFVKIALSLLAPTMAASSQTVVVLLGAANGFGFVTGAVIGYVLLHRALGDLDVAKIRSTTLWALGASLVGVAVAWVVQLGTRNLANFGGGTTAGSTFSNVGTLISTVICGVVFLIVTGLVLSRSKLPEVATLGGMLARIPMIGPKLAPATAAAPADTAAGAAGTTPDVRRGTNEFEGATPAAMMGEQAGFANEGFSATPVLPPMITDAARATRFVPGEIVAGGRFRLRSEHDTRPGVRYWRATDQADPHRGEVALIFIDTLAMPYQGMTPSSAATSIAQQARHLSELSKAGLPGLARIRSVIAARTDVLIVADWISGIDMDAFDQTPDPNSAALAVADFAEAVEYAHAAGQPLGISSIDDLRISTGGSVVAAFPTPTPNSSVDAEERLIQQVFGWMTRNCAEVPEAVRAEFENAGNSSNTANTDASNGASGEHEERDERQPLSRRLRAAALGIEGDEVPALAEAPDAPTNPRMKAAPRQYSFRQRTTRRQFVTISVTVIAAVLIIAAIAAGLVAMLSRSDDAPITTDSVRRGGEDVARTVLPKQPVLISSAAEWQPFNPDPSAGPDNPDQAGLAIDDNAETAWRTSDYYSQFGTGPNDFKPGVGLVLTLDHAITAREVELIGTPGTTVEIRSVSDQAALDPQNATLIDTQILGSAVMGEGETSINLQRAPESQYLLIWITGLPTGAEGAGAGSGADSTQTTALTGPTSAGIFTVEVLQ